MKNSAVYVICVQADAASPQGHERIWCSVLVIDFLEIFEAREFRGIWSPGMASWRP